MNCGALWLNKRKVRHASEIPENLDVGSLRGYYIAGGLLEWLRENGGEEYAERLSAISADDARLNEKLAEIFGGKLLRAKRLRTASGKLREQPLGQTEQRAQYGFTGSRRIAPSSGSFAYWQFTSFGEFWEILQKMQSGSFELGSYSQWAWLFALFERRYGSFTLGSFTSYHEWEWEWLFRLFTGGGGSFSLSSFGSFYPEFLNGLFGSFRHFADQGCFPVLDEYDRIMLETLMICPLDRFGYGVHNI